MVDEAASSSMKFDLLVKFVEWVLAALLSAAIFTSWCGFCCGDARCGRCPRKPLGFQYVLLPLLLAAMLLGFWAFVFIIDELSGLSQRLMRSGKGKTQFTCVPCAKKSEDTKIKSLGSSSASPLQVNTVKVFYWIASAFFSPSIEDGRCNVVCAAAYEAAIGEVLLIVVCSFAAAGASAAAGMQRALIGFLALVGVLASDTAIVEILLCCICRSAAFSGCVGQWVASAAAGMQQALDGLVALVSVIALETRFSVIEGLDRHVLAGSLFLGTGEQASGRVDVPGKDILQQAAAASMGSGLCLEATKGVQICQSRQVSSASPVTPVCSILVRTLSGRTRVCSLPAGFTVDELENCVSEYTAVPRSSFFLTFQGKMIAADQVKNIDSGSLIPVVMHGRLRGISYSRSLGVQCL